jgi:hypothetical protein
MLLAIDPGADTGWAVFDAVRRLTLCGLYDGEKHRQIPGSADLASISPHRLLIECPKLRPFGEKNPNAILAVARNAGEWAGRFAFFAPAEYLTPNEWKGSTPKEIDHARTWAKLDALEQGIVDRFFTSAPGRAGLAPSKRHNVLDAIGIGLFGVGRGR